MATTFKAGDRVISASTPQAYRVERTHRDGMLTVRATFATDARDEDRPGTYAGFLYRNCSPASFRAPKASGKAVQR